MIQSKTGQSPKRRFPLSFSNAFLAASIFAGGASLLSAGSAQALTEFPPPPSVTEGFYTAERLAGPTIGTAISSLDSPVGGNPLIGTVDTDFTPNIISTSGTYPGEVWYKVTKTGGPITHARIDSDFDTIPGYVTKEIYSSFNPIFPPGGSPFSGLIYTDTSYDGVPTNFKALDVPLSTIYVRDIYSVGAGGQLDNFTNTFVPGPLPILGAGAAFGFSRKLRSRIKAARLS